MSPSRTPTSSSIDKSFSSRPPKTNVRKRHFKCLYASDFSSRTLGFGEASDKQQLFPLGKHTCTVSMAHNSERLSQRHKTTWATVECKQTSYTSLEIMVSQGRLEKSFLKGSLPYFPGPQMSKLFRSCFIPTT